MRSWREARIYTPTTKPEIPPETRRAHRRRVNRAKRSRRRGWVVFLSFTCLVFLLLSLPLLEREPVRRVEAPAVGGRIDPPLAPHSLQEKIEQAADVYPGTYGVVIFDPSSGASVALNADRRFSSASLGKLAVFLTLYRAAARGELDLEDEITMLRSDVRAYGTGVLYTRPVGHTMTLRECAELLIKESDNTAWAMLDRYLGIQKVRYELRRMGANSTTYHEAVNTTTPSDVLLMLRAMADPAYTAPDLSAEMLDVMTDTSYEDRLPQPLPEETRVAHKIGSFHDTFSDAGVIFPGGSRNARDAYFMVVIAEGATEDVARSAIRSMSLTAYSFLADPPADPDRSGAGPGPS